MVLPLIEELLTGDSKEIRDVANNEAILVGFLTMAKGIDDLQGISLRFYEESRSLYQATASGHPLDDLVAILSAFFGRPAKSSGKTLPVSLRFDPTVKYLGGLRKNQVLFLKKLKTGAFYGALWPWQRDADKIEVHLGFCSSGMSNADYNQLGILVKKFLSKKKIEVISDVGGQIHGISLPSFLQMSEMEGATYTLKVTSGDRTGYLFLDGGSLIAAQYEDQTGNKAAYRIISWDNAAIQIEQADADRVREIREPLMHVMMESLKIKDEAGGEPALPPSDSPASAPLPKMEKTPSAADLQTTEKEQPPVQKATEKAPATIPDASFVMDAVELPPSVPQAIKPFEKAADRSVGKQNQMSRTGKLLIALGLVAILAAAAVGGSKYLKHRQINRRYEQFMTDLTAATALDAKIVMIMQYLKANPRDVNRVALEERLEKANTEMEKRDYDKTLSDVDHLPVDERYEKKALSLYTAFLSKYPQGSYTEPINAAIDDIRQIMGTAYFESLKALSTADWIERYTAYGEYLTQFPQGAEREAVEKMIIDLAEAVYREIEQAAAICDTQKNWDDCLARCDHFLSTFSDVPAVGKVNVLRTALQDKQDMVELTIKAELAGDDFHQAKRIYTDYLTNRPDTGQMDAIRQRIDALNADLARQTAWDKTKAYATNPANDISDRVQRVETYIQSHASGPYSAQAKNLKTLLEPELQAAFRAQRQEAKHRQDLARQQADRARRDKDIQRIKKLGEQVSRQLRPMANRFVDNGDGTVSDRITGFTWCLLDSYLDLGRCISYKTAKVYVQRLNVGNHTDWRLPTAGELASIYKNGPFFPGSGADWYWTSESFVRGYHRVVDVVTSVPETVFTRASKNENNCGNVRAIRR